jgi:hypothetical protein
VGFGIGASTLNAAGADNSRPDFDGATINLQARYARLLSLPNKSAAVMAVVPVVIFPGSDIASPDPTSPKRLCWLAAGLGIKAQAYVFTGELSVVGQSLNNMWTTKKSGRSVPANRCPEGRASRKSPTDSMHFGVPLSENSAVAVDTEVNLRQQR